MRPSSVFTRNVSRHRHLVDARDGRVLVECCVSMTLLAAASALVLLAAANTAHLVDESRQRDLVLRESSMQRSWAIATPCAIRSDASRVLAGARAILDVRRTAAPPLYTVEVDAWWQGSGFGRAPWHRHTGLAGGWCE